MPAQSAEQAPDPQTSTNSNEPAGDQPSVEEVTRPAAPSSPGAYRVIDDFSIDAFVPKQAGYDITHKVSAGFTPQPGIPLVPTSEHASAIQAPVFVPTPSTASSAPEPQGRPARASPERSDAERAESRARTLARILGDHEASAAEAGDGIDPNASLNYGNDEAGELDVKPDGAWNFHTQIEATSVDDNTVEFRAIFCQPRMVRPVSVATSSVWITVAKGMDQGIWNVVYRFEHNHLTHCIKLPLKNPAESFSSVEFRRMLKRQAKLLASPLHRIDEMIQAKKQHADDPRTQALFSVQGADTFGRKGDTGKVPPDTHTYKSAYEDAQLVMSRAALNAATTAQTPVDSKPWKSKRGPFVLPRERLRDELSKIRAAGQ
ncbi:hypothetical protein HK105_201833 [Polyrhizophydium stewartii]|uniref:Uncharacterized protein n=1 Tax=Polyrhizophydium stewartii TaxID=2732419 RepID=A0ABR4NG04_9FUNG